jgi:hypothetical protein
VNATELDPHVPIHQDFCQETRPKWRWDPSESRRKSKERNAAIRF